MLALMPVLEEAGGSGRRRERAAVRRSGPVVGAALLHDPGRGYSFTGSTEVGRNLVKERRSYPPSPRWAWRNAAFIVSGPDIDAAIEGAASPKMGQHGRACTSANRFYVHEKVP